MCALGALVATLALVTAAACGGDDSAASTTATGSPATTQSPTAAPTATRAPASATATAAATATPAPSFEGTLGPVTGAAPGSAPVTLKEVRVGTSSGFDTVVFQFDGAAVSGYSVQYVDRLPSCPVAVATPTPLVPTVPATRGRATSTPTPSSPTEPPPPTPTAFGTVAGKAMIAVRLAPATTAGGLSRSDFRGGQGALAQATQVCENENVVAWVLGVSGRQSFRVTVVNNPPRLVIDIAQP